MTCSSNSPWFLQGPKPGFGALFRGLRDGEKVILHFGESIPDEEQVMRTNTASE